MLKTKKRQRKCITDKEFAEEIIEIFEEKLEELNISLPDKCREGNEDESRIYGKTYYDLRDEIEDLIYINKKKLVVGVS